MADDLFEHPRLAAVYDALDPDRSDLDAYTAIVTELEARCVLDVGCGTGTFGLMLAERGGVNPLDSLVSVFIPNRWAALPEALHDVRRRSVLAQRQCRRKTLRTYLMMIF